MHNDPNESIDLIDADCTPTRCNPYVIQHASARCAVCSREVCPGCVLMIEGDAYCPNCAVCVTCPSHRRWNNEVIGLRAVALVDGKLACVDCASDRKESDVHGDESQEECAEPELAPLGHYRSI